MQSSRIRIIPNSIILIPFQSSMTQPNQTLLAYLRTRLPAPLLASWTHQLQQEQQLEKKNINTPATTCTNSSWRKPGNAIDRSRQKRTLRRDPSQLNNNQPSPPETTPDEAEELMNNHSTAITQKILIKNKAVFFGVDCELPYLQSSDAISTLYSQQPKQAQPNQPLFNPAPSIDRSVYATLKSLHLYYTNIDSLRQLGTGWSNLKQLSILYGKITDLSGLSSFSSLQYLFVAFNQIASLSDLMFHPSIRCLDLQRNKIQSIQQVDYLTTMDRLEYVNLNGNQVMKIKESRRIIQQKLGKMLDAEDYTRLLDYQLEQMEKQHELMGYQHIQCSNALIQACNQALRFDQISPDHLYDSHLQNVSQENAPELDFVRYECKNIIENSLDQSGCFQEEEEIIFTPLFHFQGAKTHYTAILKRYVENRLYITLKKQEKDVVSSSTAQNTLTLRSNSRLNHFASSKLQRNQDIESADKMQAINSDIYSLEKAKRTRLSLGRTKKLLQKYDKPNLAQVTPQSKLISNLSSAIGPVNSMGKTMTLKRTSLLSRKVSSNDLETEIEKKFSRTGPLLVDGQ